VVLATASLGLGGTEKALLNYAIHMDRSRFEPRVVTWNDGGPRAADLAAAGVPVASAEGDLNTLSSLVSGADVVHLFRHGFAEPFPVEACQRAGVPVLIDGNMFGAVDRSADEPLFACHLFVSQMCLLRYRSVVGSSRDFHERHRVSYLPVDVRRLRSLATDSRAAKVALGFDPSTPVVGRFGRAADLKWRDLLLDMAPHLVALVPNVQLLYVGMTAATQRRAGRTGVLEHIRAHPIEADEARLARLYSACDVVVNASAIGESLGLATAEAMALGIPVVTCSTPWTDNAQVEIVDHGTTGWVANHPRPFAEAVADLLLNADRRQAFGVAAAAKIRRLLDAERLTRQLEHLYEHHLGVAEAPLEWAPDYTDVLRFEQDYAARAKREFRPLTTREWVEVHLARQKDRALQLRASVQMTGSTLIRRRSEAVTKRTE
jgi:glycosyltransferase involved in cell wall biosynthesis